MNGKKLLYLKFLAIETTRISMNAQSFRLEIAESDAVIDSWSVWLCFIPGGGGDAHVRRSGCSSSKDSGLTKGFRDETPLFLAVKVSFKVQRTKW